MPKFGMTHRKPKPWSKRASLHVDTPRFTEDRLRANSPEHRWNDLLFPGVGYAFIALVLLKAGVAVAHRMSGSASLGFIDDLTKYVVFVAIGVLMFLVVLRRVGRWRLRRRVINARGYLCPFCAYDLRGLEGPDPQCPECGCFTPRRECVLLWCQFMRSKD